MARPKNLRTDTEKHAEIYDPNDWEAQPRRILLDAMVLAGVDMQGLVNLILENGYEDKLDERVLRQRIDRCTFRAEFLLRALKLLDAATSGNERLLDLRGQVTHAWKPAEDERRLTESTLRAQAAEQASKKLAVKSPKTPAVNARRK